MSVVLGVAKKVSTMNLCIRVEAPKLLVVNTPRMFNGIMLEACIGRELGGPILGEGALQAPMRSPL